MFVLVDVVVVAVVALAAFVEVRRGLFLSLSDVLRIVLALTLGVSAYSLAHRLTHSYALGFVALGFVALVVVMFIPFLIRLSRLDPAWGRTVASRVGAGLLGAGIGAAIVVTFLPIANQNPRNQPAIAGSFLAAAALEASPAFYYIADALDLDIPMLNRRAVRFEDEGEAAKAALVERINYSRLAGSTCIECRGRVQFAGYRRRFEASVSPRFVCRQCGRTSDGCQTFEGFHRMYGRCPVEVSAQLGPIDCGVWSNDRPVYPLGPCPVDGKQLARRLRPSRSTAAERPE
jgi:hypothetical protein